MTYLTKLWWSIWGVYLDLDIHVILYPSQPIMWGPSYDKCAVFLLKMGIKAPRAAHLKFIPYHLKICLVEFVENHFIILTILPLEMAWKNEYWLDGNSAASAMLSYQTEPILAMEPHQHSFSIPFFTFCLPNSPYVFPRQSNYRGATYSCCWMLFQQLLKPREAECVLKTEKNLNKVKSELKTRKCRRGEKLDMYLSNLHTYHSILHACICIWLLMFIFYFSNFFCFHNVILHFTFTTNI